MGTRGDPGRSGLSARSAKRSGLSALPAVHELAAALHAPHGLAVAAARLAIEEQRTAIIFAACSGSEPVARPAAEPGAVPDRGRNPGPAAEPATDLLARARELLERSRRPSLRRVLNATGVIVHTNLGRAPLPATAREAVNRAAEGYSNLELDLGRGTRGSRRAHVEDLLCELTGARAATVVNNGAAAVLLAVAALAGPGRAVVVSRGELVEIGGGFRIPEVIGQSGSELIEVGTTNRTRLQDYQRALDAAPPASRVSAILRVHRSNFATVGFVQDVPIQELCKVGVPVIDDAGSGVLADGAEVPALTGEPALKRSVAAGAALVCCSGDKLLGGPQAGLLIGTQDAVAAAAAHPLARALRIDKLSLAALEATLMLYREPERARREIPVLAMLTASEETLAARARRLRAGIGSAAELVRATAKAGGGALPLLELEGPAVALYPDGEDALALARALRGADPPVIARINGGRVLLDPRTLGDDEVELAITAVRGALGAPRSPAPGGSRPPEGPGRE
ncbi:MAG: L-seryl-tRNA(Sec) selenium transferase [Actinomycetota bacterium]|nr:L-seryl-tRNA(Sec) selenium transferase [Actinomycetota bacterium]